MNSIMKRHLFFMFYTFMLTITTTLALPSLPSHHGFPTMRLKGRSIPEDLEEEQTSPLKGYKSFFYNQTLDHFTYRPDSYETFGQKYLINTKYWGGAKTNSPIFVYLGAEETILSDVQAVGWFDQFAPQFKALTVFIEHRYYGDSNPVPYSLPVTIIGDTENRGYFSSAQALADYAEVILYLKKKLKADHSPVIVFGGSYGGMLAAWFRFKYPHVALGALASSAPILNHVRSPYTYDNWVTHVYKETSMSCYNTIKHSWAEIDRVAKIHNGLSTLTKAFKLCSGLKSLQEVHSLKLIIKSKFEQSTQYDAPPGYPVSKICNAIDGAPKGASIIDKLAAGYAAFSRDSYDEKKKCYHVLDSEQSDDSLMTQYGWNWQVCTEIMLTNGGIANDTIFEPAPWTTKTYISDCRKGVYGFKARPRPNWLNIYYGGKDIKLVLQNSASNVIFYNGLRDPLSQMSVLESLSETLVAVNAPKGSHCLDLLKSSKTDPEWLVTLRKKEAAIIKVWISKYYVDLAAYLKGHK